MSNRHIEEEVRESEKAQGQGLRYSWKQGPEFLVNNDRRGKIPRQKESKYLFPVHFKPTSSSLSLLGSPLSTKPSAMGLT